jgi:hypothetical protein
MYDPLKEQADLVQVAVAEIEKAVSLIRSEFAIADEASVVAFVRTRFEQINRSSHAFFRAEDVATEYRNSMLRK